MPPLLSGGLLAQTFGVTEIIDPAGNYFPSGDPAPGGAWVVEDDWSVTGGDLVFIENAFQARGGRPRAGCIQWSPDGTRLTLQSTSSDDTICFNIATPFDPDTADAVLFSMAKTNPTFGMFNAAGTRWVEMAVGDRFNMYPALNWVITSSVALSTVSKADVGFTSSTDGDAIWGPLFDYNLWMGGQPSDAVKDVSFPGADLGAFVVESTVFNGLINPNAALYSNFDLAEIMCYQGAGSQGVYIVSFNSPRETTSFVRSAAYDLRNNVPASFDFRPGTFWFDPNNTRYVWGCADPTGNLQIVKYDTGAGV